MTDCTAFRDDMLDVLYGEADFAVRRRFAEHEAACASCQEELAGLRRVRSDLAAWALPAAVPPARRPRAFWRPAAVAAALLLALSGAFTLSGSELRYDDGGLALRVGRGAPRPEAAERRLAAIEARQREEIEELRRELARVRTETEQATLARVARLIEDSEARQAVLVGASMASLREEADARRRYDLAQVGAGLSYLEGKTGLQAARTTELMGHVLLAAQKR
ncbi:MAG TPA: hypothetical protein VIG50_19350 [Vicinamibacteria bacterium]